MEMQAELIGARIKAEQVQEFFVVQKKNEELETGIRKLEEEVCDLKKEKEGANLALQTFKKYLMEVSY